MFRSALAIVMLVTLPALAYSRYTPASSTAAAAASTAGTPPRCSSGGQPTTCQIDVEYVGGQVLSNAKAYAVFWGGAVDPGTTGNIGGFLDAVTNSPWMDWLSEYSTNLVVLGGPKQGQQGTNQIVGRGVYAGAFTIQPAKCGAGGAACTVDDSDIQSELAAQIAAGHLPPSDANAIFMVYFPPGVTITKGTESSCQVFCAYHKAFTDGQEAVTYGVFPDFGPTGGCSSGCGHGASAFDNLCSTSSHELGEAISDAQNALAAATNNLGYLGWYDVAQNSQGEIGDMCNQDQTTNVPGCVVGTAGCYVVQQLFSKATWDAANGDPSTPACISVSGDPNDYSLALNPNSATLAPGAAPVPVAIDIASAGNPGALTLSVTAQPGGVHATVDHSSLMLSLDAAASVHDGLVVIQATGARTHSAAILVNGGAAAAPGDDFSISLAPASLTLAPGGAAGSFTVSTALASGSATQSITLSASGIPAGVSGSFAGGAASVTVTVGQSATLTISPGASPVAQAQIVVTGKSAAVPAGHTATGTVTVAAAASGPGAVLTQPEDGAHLTGTVTVSASATVDPGAHGIAALEILVDGVVAGKAQTSPAAWSWDTTQVPNGRYVVEAMVIDGLGHSATSSPAAVTIENAATDFGLQISGSPVVTAGSTVTVQIATSATGSPAPITLAAGGLPGGVTASFAPNPVQPGATSTMTLATGAAAAAGAASLTVTGTSGTLTHSAKVAFTIAAPPSHGGCSTTSASPLALAALAMLLLRRRPRRRLPRWRNEAALAARLNPFTVPGSVRRAPHPIRWPS